MLTPRERVIKALSFEVTDIVPYHIACEDGVAAKVMPHLEQTAYFPKFTNHLPFYNFEPKQYWTSPDCYSDEFGSVWKVLNKVPHLVEYPLKAPALKGYIFPEFTFQAHTQEIKNFLSDHSEHFVLCGMAQGFFDRGWAMRGMENFMTDFIENPGFVEQFFEILTEYYLKLLEAISIYPFDGIRFGDDWGTQRGLVMGPKRWRKFIKPGLQKIFEKARQHGLVVMLHSDGDIMDIIPDLIEIGVQILNPIQPEAMNIIEIKRQYGNTLCLNGGISSQYTLPWGTPEDVRQEVTACLRYLGRSGGYIIGPTKSIFPETPSDNILALYETIINQPTGPLPISEPFPACVPELERVYRAFHS
jgi:uroporphyrinogen decarboxylase